MPNVIQDKFKVVVGLGIVNWFKSGKKHETWHVGRYWP